jgi:hypothetical protein
VIGYRAVIEVATEYGKLFSGDKNNNPAKVLVLGLFFLLFYYYYLFYYFFCFIYVYILYNSILFIYLFIYILYILLLLFIINFKFLQIIRRGGFRIIRNKNGEVYGGHCERF